jgi:hypothetical protein
MSKPTSLVTFLLDRSGSMTACKAVTIEAFNGYIAGLQVETEATINFTFLQFDTQSLDKVCVAVPVSDVRPLTNATYQPRGGTPLIDAAMKTIKAVEGSLASRDDKPRVVICIQTDGEENTSTEYTWEELRGVVTRKTVDGWQFNFMGAGIDGYIQAAKMGVGAMNTMSYDPTNPDSTLAAFRATAENTRSFGAGRSMNTSYSMKQRTDSGDRFASHHLSGDLDLTTSQPAARIASRRKTVPDISL